MGSILERFGPLRRTGGGYAAKCPAHDDRVASLSVRVADDGRILLYCHAGCETEAVVQALGLEWGDLAPGDDQRLKVRSLPRSKNPSAHGRVLETAKVLNLPLREVASYPYHDAEGRLLFEVVRFEPKTFRQRRQTPSGPAWGLGNVRPVLYRLPTVLAALSASKPIFLVEGEKDADRVSALGYVATTAPMGAGKWRPAFTQTLAGGTIYVVSDRDTPGRRHAREVMEQLREAGCRVVWLEAKAGKDVSDHLDAGLALTDLRIRARY